jgi:LPS export ABC transporter protein LptC
VIAPRLLKQMVSTAAAAVASAVLAACTVETTQPPRHDAKEEVTSRQVMYELHQRITKNGIVKADLHSDTATSRPDNPTIDLKGVRLAFFDEQGKPSGNVTSRTGEYDTGTGAMIARGGVVLVLHDPKGTRTIHSEELHYDQRGDRVWSDKPTTMEQEGKTYHGTSFQSNTRFTNLTVQSLTTSGIPTRNGKDGGLSF